MVDGALEELLGRKPKVVEEAVRQLLVEGKGSEAGGYTYEMARGGK